LFFDASKSDSDITFTQIGDAGDFAIAHAIEGEKDEGAVRFLELPNGTVE
jgi:hypothetical protein